MQIQKGMPLYIIRKAAKAVAAVNAGDVYPIKSRNGKFETVRVGRRYRLLRKPDSEWELLSHEAYNSRIK